MWPRRCRRCLASPGRLTEMVSPSFTALPRPSSRSYTFNPLSSAGAEEEGARGTGPQRRP
jgi:hypothetical protein